jgi:Cellulase (glycosyl hydrolase family 5)
MSRVRVAARLSVAVALVLGIAIPMSARGAAAPRVSGWFLFGANMPWLHWNADFGGGPNGGGVSGNVAEVGSKLQAARNAGMRQIRWWVFEGGSPQIQRNASGTPTGLNPNVYTDLDAALTEAARFDITYNFVLFGSTNDDATTHQWWEDGAKRQALVSVLIPLFRRYANEPRIHTWEIVNEPEWQSRNGITSVAGMLATVDALTNAVHQNTNKLVTVGNAQMQDMATWRGHPLDYYSPHYYDGFGTGFNDPFVTAAASASPDGKPVVIGEWQGSSGLNPSAQNRWQALYSGGYAGGWPWSLSPEHTYDKIPTDLTAAAAFAQGKSDLGPRVSGTPPLPTPTSTLVPATSTPTRTPTLVPPTSTPTRTATSVPPTSTATRTPTPVIGNPTATATPAQTMWTMRAAVRSATLSAGATQRIRDTVTASHNAIALVDIEIWDQQWNKVFQQYWDNRAFTAGTPRTFTANWTVPAGARPGTYTVFVGTFVPGWQGLYSFDKNAATFTVR